MESSGLSWASADAMFEKEHGRYVYQIVQTRWEGV